MAVLLYSRYSVFISGKAAEDGLGVWVSAIPVGILNAGHGCWLLHGPVQLLGLLGSTPADGKSWLSLSPFSSLWLSNTTTDYVKTNNVVAVYSKASNSLV